MSIHKRWLFFMFSCALINSVSCQHEENLPASFDQFFKNFYLLNPATCDVTKQVSLTVGNRTLTGLFEGVSRFYAGTDLLLNTKSKYNFHSLGLLAITGKEGDYFHRNRIYGRYSWKAAITKNVSFSAGVAAGIVNYNIKGSTASAGGSATSPDANIGVWLLTKNLDVGLSYQQILNSKLRPLEQLFVLNRYFNGNINLHSAITEGLTIHTYLFSSLLPDKQIIAIGGPLLVIDKKIETGIMYRYKRGVAITGGLASIPIFKGNLRIGASYLISTRKLSDFTDNIIEFSAGFDLSEALF